MVTEEKKDIYSYIPENMCKYFRKAGQYRTELLIKIKNNLILMIVKGEREDFIYFFLVLSLLSDLFL